MRRRRTGPSRLSPCCSRRNASLFRHGGRSRRSPTSVLTAQARGFFEGGRSECQSIPIERLAVSTSVHQNPPLSYGGNSRAELAVSSGSFAQGQVRSSKRMEIGGPFVLGPPSSTSLKVDREQDQFFHRRASLRWVILPAGAPVRSVEAIRQSIGD